MGGPIELVPTLTPSEMERLFRFGDVCRFADGEKVFETGRPSPGMCVILSGRMVVSMRDGLGQITPVTEQGRGGFLAELAELSGIPTLFDGTALGEVEALVIPAPGLRALMIEEADLGERIMQTLMLRRVHPLKGDAGGVVLIGPPDLGDTLRLQNFFARLSFPCHTLDPPNDRLAADVVER